MSKYSVAIIGAGRIAAGFDGPGSESILTHAHAFSKNPTTHLIGFYDLDEKKARDEALRWNTNVFSSLEELLASKPDIVVIASPDETHARFLTALDGKVRVIVCEKPIATSREDLDIVRAVQTPVIVNFRRRFDPTILHIQQELRTGVYGRVITGGGMYSKGLLHNGSHLIDLVRFLFGEMITAQKLFSINDWEGGETVSAFCTFEKCPSFHLMAGDERAFSIFELDIITEKKRFRFLDEGFALETQNIIPDPVFKGYQVLGDTTRQKTGLIESMRLLTEHVVDVIEGSESRSSIHEAVKTHAACLKILGEE